MYEEGLCFPGNIEHLKLSYIVTGETSNECYVITEKGSINPVVPVMSGRYKGYNLSFIFAVWTTELWLRIY